MVRCEEPFKYLYCSLLFLARYNTQPRSVTDWAQIKDQFWWTTLFFHGISTNWNVDGFIWNTKWVSGAECDEASADPRASLKLVQGPQLVCRISVALWSRASPRRAPEESFSSDKHTAQTSHRPAPRLNAHVSECGSTRGGAFVPELFVWDLCSLLVPSRSSRRHAQLHRNTHSLSEEDETAGCVKQHIHVAAHTVLFQVFFWALSFWVWFLQVLHSKEAAATNGFKEPWSHVSVSPTAVWRSRDPLCLLRRRAQRAVTDAMKRPPLIIQTDQRRKK